jgi:hypothetical protein
MVVVLPARSWRDACPPRWRVPCSRDRPGAAASTFRRWPTSARARAIGSSPGRHTGSTAPGTLKPTFLVIGESVRSDTAFPAVVAGHKWRRLPDGSLLYCDVVVRFEQHAHVGAAARLARPPGSRERVSRDATMLKAFEAAGFETFLAGGSGAFDRLARRAESGRITPGPAWTAMSLLPLLRQGTSDSRAPPS